MGAADKLILLTSTEKISGVVVVIFERLALKYPIESSAFTSVTKYLNEPEVTLTIVTFVSVAEYPSLLPV
jgi:hypothetical protein